MYKSSTFGSRITHGLLALIVAVSAILFTTSAPAYAGTTQDEAAFVQMINNLRASKGLAPLQVDGELTVASRSWAQNMSSQDKLYHAPDISAGVTANWKALGENVGVSTSHDTASLFEAFVQSPLHYKNLVDPRFTHVGVGVVYAPSGKMWTTHRFMQLGQAPQTLPPTTQAPATTAAPATAPPKTVPPQTAAPFTQPPATAAPKTQATTATTARAKKTTTTAKSVTTATAVKKTATTLTQKPKDTKVDTKESEGIVYFEPKYSQTELRAKVLLEAGA